MEDIIVKADGISKAYQADGVLTQALDQVSFELRTGDFVAVMGPSGCGKSTLLNIAGLIDKPSAGECFFMGQTTCKMTEKQRAALRNRYIGFVFQSFNLLDELTVQENIELPLLYMDIPAADRKKKLKEIMERMNIAHRANHFPLQLSGGQQQRAAIARAVVTRPALILADEPTGNLDSVNGQEVMNMLTELNEEGTAIIMATHSAHDADFAHRIINLLDGQLVSENINQTSL
jgi:putative ABC transport system ATP-binding protein